MATAAATHYVNSTSEGRGTTSIATARHVLQGFPVKMFNIQPLSRRQGYMMLTATQYINIRAASSHRTSFATGGHVWQAFPAACVHIKALRGAQHVSFLLPPDDIELPPQSGRYYV